MLLPFQLLEGLKFLSYGFGGSAATGFVEIQCVEDTGVRGEEGHDRGGIGGVGRQGTDGVHVRDGVGFLDGDLVQGIVEVGQLAN